MNTLVIVPVWPLGAHAVAGKAAIRPWGLITRDIECAQSRTRHSKGL